MKGKNKFVNLLKATRIERSLIPLSFILLTLSFSNQITNSVIILAVCSILLYISGGILNAKIDRDYELPKIAGILIVVLILTTIILSLQNKIIFLSVLLWIILNIIYNKYSRKIIFADSFILSMTHAGIPVIMTSLLLGFSIILIIKIAMFSIVLAMLLIPMKNLKGIKEDKNRGYKTILTKYSNGKVITIILFNLSFIILIFGVFLFYFNQTYLFLLTPIIILYLLVNYLFLIKKENIAYEFSRLIPILVSLVFIYSSNSSIKIIFASILLIFIYTMYLFFNIK